MSIYALKIVPVCPSILLDKSFRPHFSAESGILIPDLGGFFSELEEHWDGRKFSPDEKRKLLDTTMLLKQRGAFVDYTGKRPSGVGSSHFSKVCDELRNPDRLIEFSVSADDQTNIPDDLRSLFFTTEEVIDKGKHIHRHLKVRRVPTALSEIMTPYPFMSSTFKFIDPYMFEMDSRNVKARMDFLIETCNQIKLHNRLPRDEIKIEVIARSYKFVDRKRVDIKQDDLKKVLLQDRRLMDLAEEFQIRFIGLDDYLTEYHDDEDGEPYEKIHKRFFYTEKYLISLEYPFETKTNETNIIWFGQEYRRSEIARTYREDSDIFNAAFGFFAHNI